MRRLPGAARASPAPAGRRLLWPRSRTIGILAVIVAQATTTLAADVRSRELRVVVTDPPRSARPGPVTGGMPLPRGFCPDSRRLALRLEEDGTRLPLQASALSRWPDGSIRWVLMTFAADASVPRRSYLVTADAREPAPAPAVPLRVTEASGSIEVDCGPLRIRFRDGQAGLWDDFVLVRDGDELRPFVTGGSLAVIAADGLTQPVFPVAARCTLEEAGPLRAVVKVSRSEPIVDGAVDCFARIFCHAGEPWIRLDLTIVNCSDPGDVAYRDEILRPQRGVKRVGSIPLCFDLADWVGTSATFGGDRPPAATAPEGDSAAARLLRQESPSAFTVCHGSTFRRETGQAEGWAQVGQLRLAVREFWQQFPKAIGYDPRLRRLTLDLCASGEEDPFLFNPGVAKTHQIAIDFGDGGGSDLVMHPPLCWLPPGAVLATEAVPPFGLVDPTAWPGFEALAAETAATWLARAANGRSPGFLHYGDPGGNGYHHPDHDLMLHFFRTGDTGLFAVASAQARHRADVDIMHYPPELRGWHHTEYPADHWDPRSGCIKEWIAGLCDYYCLTGDRRALDALEEVGDWITRARPRDASRNAALPLGWMAQIAPLTDKPEHWDELRGLYAHLREVALNDAYGDRMFSVGHLVDGLFRYWSATGDGTAIPAIVRASTWFYRQTGSPSGTIPSEFERGSAGIYFWAPGEIVSVAAQAYSVTGDLRLLQDGLGAFDSYLNWYEPILGWPLGSGAGMHQMQWACRQAGIDEAAIGVEPWGGFVAAEAWLRERLGTGGDDDSLTVELARTLTNARRFDDALEAVQERRAHKRPGDRFWAELTHAQALVNLRKGDWEAARAAYAELHAGLRAVTPDHPPSPVATATALWGQAVASEKLGDREAALAAYEACSRVGVIGRGAIAAERAAALRGR